MEAIGRRAFLAAGASAGVAALASSGLSAAAAPARSRMIATEEAFAIPEYISGYLRSVENVETTAARYLKMYYGRQTLIDQLCDMNVRLAEMDRYNVDMHLLSLTAPGVQAFDDHEGPDLAELANDRLAAIIAAHPTRFAGLGAIAPQSVERSVREIGRIMGALRLGGIIINGHTRGEYLDEPKYWPILAAAEAASAPIYLHPTFPHESVAAPYSRYGMIGALWAFGSDTGTHVVRLILSGVFDEFPNLQIVLGHLGEGLPFWLGRLDNRYQNLLRRGGLEPLGMRRLRRLPSEYFRSNFYLTTSGMNTDPPLDFCIRLLGAERIMFAIDYPFEQTAEASTFIRNFPSDDRVKEKLLSRTAETLFKIPPATA
jgi:2,3-dihydroxybenzoate decarboxylase